MYERFTEGARKAMQFANVEAQRLGHQYIGCEHILLGVLAQQDEVTDFCKSLGIAPHRFSQQFELLSPTTSSAESPQAKKVIEYAIEEARELNHSNVGTLHMLLGILRVPSISVTSAMNALGVNRDELRAELVRRFPASDEIAGPALDVLVSRFEKHPDVCALRERVRECQSKKEESVAVQDFMSAAGYRDQEVALRMQLRELLNGLQDSLGQK